MNDLHEIYTSEQVDDIMETRRKEDKKYRRFLIILTALGLSIPSAGAIMQYIKNKESNTTGIEQTYKDEECEKTFDTGEQYVYQLQVYGKDKTKYDEVDGYKLLGFTKEDVVYTNTEPVKCVGHTNEDGYVVYSFGKPVEKNKTLELTPSTEE